MSTEAGNLLFQCQLLAAIPVRLSIAKEFVVVCVMIPSQVILINWKEARVVKLLFGLSNVSNFFFKTYVLSQGFLHSVREILRIGIYKQNRYS